VEEGGGGHTALTLVGVDKKNPPIERIKINKTTRFLIALFII
jgi:hypothetical protein